MSVGPNIIFNKELQVFIHHQMTVSQLNVRTQSTYPQISSSNGTRLVQWWYHCTKGNTILRIRESQRSGIFLLWGRNPKGEIREVVVIF